MKNKLISLSFSRSSSFFSSLPLFLCYTFLFFFLSLTLCHSLFFTLLLFSQLLLSLFFSHFLSLAFTISISFCLSFSPSFFTFSLSLLLLFLPLFLLLLVPISFFHTRFFSFSLYAMCDFARQRIDCRSIRVPFPPCCALPLYGHVYRERRRVLFTGTTVALVLRIHIVEIKFSLLLSSG